MAVREEVEGYDVRLTDKELKQEGINQLSQVVTFTPRSLPRNPAGQTSVISSSVSEDPARTRRKRDTQGCLALMTMSCR